MTRKPTVRILAYGSLINDPREEIEEVRTDTIKNVRTPFPVEFARSSDKRGGAPTLVPWDKGARVRAAVIVVSTSVEDATNRLFRREIDAVGSEHVYEHSENPGPNKVIVKPLKGQFGLDVVLYTQIAANIPDLRAEKLADLAIGSVGKAKEERDGITYLMNAMEAGIETPLSAAYEAEILRRSGADDLAGALAWARTRTQT